MSESDNDYRPTVDDVDPSALAVNSVEDSVRVAGDPSETDTVDAAGETRRVDDPEQQQTDERHDQENNSRPEKGANDISHRTDTAGTAEEPDREQRRA